VSSEGQGALTLATLRHQRYQRQEMVRRVLPVALAATIIAVGRSTPGPGGHGIHLGVLLAMAGLVVATIGTLLTWNSPRPQTAMVGLMLASSVALIWCQPGGPATIALFLSVAFGARQLPGRAGIVLGFAACGLILLLVVLEGFGVYVTHPALGVPGVIVAGSTLLVAAFGRRIDAQDSAADAMLVELEQTRGAELRAAALAERQRLAREMHDVLAHSLSGLVMQLEGARLLAASDPADPRLTDTIDRASHLARSGLNEARRAISMLRDEELPGPESIEAMTTEFTRDSGIPCSFASTGSRRDVGSETRLALYRVAQEALTNIRKHATPDRVSVTLAYQPRAVSLVVEDIETSSGTSPAATGPVAAGSVAAPDGGYGLTGMRERAELLGGTLTAGLTGHGFRVELRVPA
jgi:signal transduction histidine kinase